MILVLIARSRFKAEIIIVLLSLTLETMPLNLCIDSMGGHVGSKFHLEHTFREEAVHTLSERKLYIVEPLSV